MKVNYIDTISHPLRLLMANLQVWIMSELSLFSKSSSGQNLSYPETIIVNIVIFESSIIPYITMLVLDNKVSHMAIKGTNWIGLMCTCKFSNIIMRQKSM
jgi:hypothetical protein